MADLVSDRRRWRSRYQLKETYQAHCAIAQPGDLWSILAELGGWQLGVTGDLANDFPDLVHGVCCVLCVV